MRLQLVAKDFAPRWKTHLGSLIYTEESETVQETANTWGEHGE